MQAIGLSRGGQTTKIHVLTDVLGRPAVIRLTPGNVSDIRIADDLIEAAGPVRHLIADRGYDANRPCATPFGQREQYRSFQADVRADVRSGTMSDATAIAGGSKLRSVASRTFVVLPHAMTSSPSTSCPPSSSLPSSHSGSE